MTASVFPLRNRHLVRGFDLEREAPREARGAVGIEHRADDRVRGVVLTGAGSRAFSAGGDLSGGFVDSPLPGHAERGALADLFRAMRDTPKPIVAAVASSLAQ